MKTSDIKTRLDELKNNIITSVDTSFSQFVIESFIEKNQLDFIIDDELRYKYWKEQAFSINEFIQELNYDPSVNKDFLKEVIKIKSIIDNNLLKLKDKDTISIDLGFEFDSSSDLPTLLEEPQRSKVIHSVYQSLCDNGLMEIGYHEFKELITK